MSENTEVALNPENPREREMILVEREFALTQRKANALSKANIIPKDYQNNIPNCLVAMEMAARLGVGDLEIMQNLDVIHGRPSFRATYLIAMVNKSGVLKGRLRFRMTGTKGKDDWGCIAYGTCAETGETLEGSEITIAIAKAEGWYNKNGSKWKTIPQQMLQYRAAAFFSRTHAPDATMGMHTADEMQDVSEREVNPQHIGGTGPKASGLNEAITVVAEEAEPVAIAEVETEAETAPAAEQEPVPVTVTADNEEAENYFGNGG